MRFRPLHVGIGLNTQLYKPLCKLIVVIGPGTFQQADRRPVITCVDQLVCPTKQFEIGLHRGMLRTPQTSFKRHKYALLPPRG